jgi:hypothetical protein
MTLAGPQTVTGSKTFTGNNAMTAGQNAITVYSLNSDIVLDNNKYTNVQAALTACGSNPCIIRVPSGTWPPAAANTALTINQSNVHIICSGFDASTISYTGTTAITAVVDIGTSTTGSPSYGNISINGCTISGNANAQYAIRLRSIHRSNFAHNKLINVTQAGIQTNFAVVDTFDDIHTSSQEQAFTTTPVNCMVLDGPDSNHKTTATVIKNPICEGVSGTGIVLNNTATVQIIGGTSEQNNKGLTLSSGAVADAIYGLDTELNTVSNVEANGFQCRFENLTGNGLFHVLGTASNFTYITGLFYDTITIDSGAQNTHLDHVGYNNSGSGTFTDSGAGTVKVAVQNLVGAAYVLAPASAAGAPAQVLAAGTATLSTTAIGAGACGAVATGVATGATASSQVNITSTTAGSTPSTADGLLTLQYWLTANQFNVRQCNPTASSQTPGGLTVGFKLVQ